MGKEGVRCVIILSQIINKKKIIANKEIILPKEEIIFQVK